MRLAMLWDGDSFPTIITDDPSISVYNVDEGCPDDRLFLMGSSIKRVSAAQFDALLGESTVHQFGDKPVVEQAIRAVLDLKPNGKPSLSLVDPSSPAQSGGPL